MAVEQAQMPAVEAKSGIAFSPGLVKFAKDCVAGTLGGIAVVGVGHPFGENTIFLRTRNIKVYSALFLIIFYNLPPYHRSPPFPVSSFL